MLVNDFSCRVQLTHLECRIFVYDLCVLFILFSFNRWLVWKSKLMYILWQIRARKNTDSSPKQSGSVSRPPTVSHPRQGGNRNATVTKSQSGGTEASNSDANLWQRIVDSICLNILKQCLVFRIDSIQDFYVFIQRQFVGANYHKNIF